MNDKAQTMTMLRFVMYVGIHLYAILQYVAVVGSMQAWRFVGR
jgi:hypothetical protein